MAGSKGATWTVVAALFDPSTVTTNCAEVTEPRSGGTTRLICVALLNRMVACRVLKVTETFVPVNAEPMMVVREPGTTGTGAQLAAFTTLVTAGTFAVTTGVVTLVAACVTTNVTGTEAVPPAPVLTTMVA